MLLAMLLGAAPAVAIDPRVCQAARGARPSVAGVTVTDGAAREGAYRTLRVATVRGGWMTILFDPGSEAAARARAACLGMELALLQELLGDDRAGAEWASAVFTQDATYTPERRQGLRPRWVVRIAADGSIGQQAHEMIVSTIPHEQVHDYQNRAGARLPRWFGEGHASWVGMAVTARIDPAVLAATRARWAKARADARGPLNLAGWGSVRPKREAILRQVSAADRARMERDPSFSPGGTFSFTSADLIGDESNMPARYAASVAVFEALAARHGAAKVRAFATAATAGPGPVAPRLTGLVQEHFGETLDTLLAEPAAATRR